MKKLFTAAALLMASMNVLGSPIQVITTCSVSDTTTSYCVDATSSAQGALNKNLTIAAFDDSKGTLTGVSLKFSGLINSNGSITNVAEDNSDTRATAAISAFNWKFSGSGFSGDFGTVNHEIESSNAGEYTIKPNDAFTWANADLTSGIIDKAFTATDLSIFSADVIFKFESLLFSSYENQTTDGAAAYTVNAVTTQFGAVEAIYTYETSASPATGVPEPVSILMFGLGLIGLSQTRKAKKCLIG
jgi:hypothetical protein